MVGTYEEQVALEEQQKEITIKRYADNLYKAIETQRFDETKEGILLMKLGFEPFVKKLEEFFDDTGVRHRGQTLKDKNFLSLMCDDPKVLAVITMSTIISSLGLRSSYL